MNRMMTGAAVLALTAGGAMAAGVERSASPVSFMFEQGSYAELSFGYVSPTVTGSALGAQSGDMAPGYATVALAYKADISDRLSIGILLDQPLGADVAYPTGTGYAFAGATASLDSTAVTAILKYTLPSNVSMYGGIRIQTASGQVAIPTLAGTPVAYTMETSRETDIGWLAGAAFERPDIALRVALTYASSITHDFTSTENGTPFIPPLTGTGQFASKAPQSLTLDFQSGVAADTLIFGSIRWVDWSEFDIAPPGFTAFRGPLVDYNDDAITYNLGLGRRFNDQWSGAVTVGYEAAGGAPVGNLGPTDGSTSVGLGATYTTGNMEVTGGVRYVKIGDAVTSTIGGQFTNNSAWAAGIRVGFNF